MQAAVRTTLWTGVEERLILSAIFLLALLARLVVVGMTIGFHTSAAWEPASDTQIHIALVENLLGGRGYTLDDQPGLTPPLYIFFLAGLYRFFDTPAAVRLVQAALGAAGCLLLFAIGRKAFGRTTGLVAAGLLTIYPLAVFLPALHLTENLFLFLLLLVIWQCFRVAERPTAPAIGALGALIGLTALTRSVFLAFPPFLFGWIGSVWGWRSRQTYRVFGLAVLSTLLVLLPWTVRNYLALGAIVPIQANGGLMFWAGNNPYAKGGIVWPTRETWTATSPPDDNTYGWRHLSVAEENALYVRTALSWIRDHPRDYVRLLGQKLARLYGFARATDEQALGVRYRVRFIHAAFDGAALVGLILAVPRWRKLSLLIALIVFTNVMALVFGGATRYTVPMVPSLVLLSAHALTAWRRPTTAEEGAR